MNEEAVRIALDAGAKAVRLRKAEAELSRLRAAVQTMADNSLTPRPCVTRCCGHSTKGTTNEPQP